MVNTVILAVVTLASLFNVVWGAASENSVNFEISEQTNGTDLMPEEDYSFDYGNEYDGFDYMSIIEERKRCPASKKCTDAGGSCIKSKAYCDGTVDTRACKGKKCKCCIPARTTTVCPPCPTVPQCTTQVTTRATVPAGFELFNGKVIRRTKKSDAMGNYTVGISFCKQFGAKPFIPKTSADYDLYRDVRTALGTIGWMWIPADDRRQEGTLRWYNGALASDTSLLDWYRNQTEVLNSAISDCAFYGFTTGRYRVYMTPCYRVAHPPICKIK